MYEVFFDFFMTVYRVKRYCQIATERKQTPWCEISRVIGVNVNARLICTLKSDFKGATWDEQGTNLKKYRVATTQLDSSMTLQYTPQYAEAGCYYKKKVRWKTLQIQKI